MNNEQNNDNNQDKQEQAKKLFLQTSFTQAQIAEILGVTQKTISVWTCQGKWKGMKEAAKQTPLVIIEQLSHELTEINSMIMARKTGERFPTTQEAEVRRKIMQSIKYMKEHQTIGSNIEVLTNFTLYVQKKNFEEAKKITLYADQYLKSEKRFDPAPQIIPYQLPDIDSYTSKDEPLTDAA